MLLLATHGHNAITGHAPKRVTFANLTFSRPNPTTTFGRVVAVTPPAAAADAGAPAAAASLLHSSRQQHGHIVIAVPEGQPGLDSLLIDRCASSMIWMYCTVLYCTILYCTVLYFVLIQLLNMALNTHPITHNMLPVCACMQVPPAVRRARLVHPTLHHSAAGISRGPSPHRWAGWRIYMATAERQRPSSL